MRIYFVKVLFLLMFLTIFLRLFYWQIVRADELQAKAENQRFENQKIESKRGNIFYSDGTVLAATKPAFLLYGQPKLLGDEEKNRLSKTLAKVLLNEGDEKVLQEELKLALSQDLFWVVLQKNVSFEKRKEIEGLNLKGLGFEEQNKRFYPEGSSSAQMLGFVGSDSKGDTGYFGLEGKYNGELKGFTGLLKIEKDARGLPILIGNFLGNPSIPGKDLVLNIDRTVQFIVEKNLQKGMEKYGAKAASAIVMEPGTGAILSMASYPGYDPANFDKFSKDVYKNSVVADSYEPGSTFKVLVMSGAINENLVKPETQCDICSGPVEVGGYKIRTWNNKYLPNLTMTDVIIHSDNTGMVFTGRKLGFDKIYSYIENFGFGDITGVDLQDEFSPDIRSKDSWKEIDLTTASFGQVIAVTPIQMIRAVGALANGGNLMEPHIVREIKGVNGNFEIKPKIVRQVVSEATSKVITEMMVKAVDEGEAKFAKPKGFKIAGKTGTAQIPVAGYYDPNKTIASFVGFAPADNPKFVMLVRFDQPTSSIFGSETAAPTFFEIAKELFTYYKIAPNE